MERSGERKTVNGERMVSERQTGGERTLNARCVHPERTQKLEKERFRDCIFESGLHMHCVPLFTRKL